MGINITTTQCVDCSSNQKTASFFGKSSVLFTCYKKKINYSLYDLRYVKPLDIKNLKNIFKKYKNIFVIEEHYENGGSYSAILEEFNKMNKKRSRLFSIGIKNKFITFAAIDNLVKGASGQAIQNMNLLYDFPEQLGLKW